MYQQSVCFEQKTRKMSLFSSENSGFYSREKLHGHVIVMTIVGTKLTLETMPQAVAVGGHAL